MEFAKRQNGKRSFLKRKNIASSVCQCDVYSTSYLSSDMLLRRLQGCTLSYSLKYTLVVDDAGSKPLAQCVEILCVCNTASYEGATIKVYCHS